MSNRRSTENSSPYHAQQHVDSDSEELEEEEEELVGKVTLSEEQPPDANSSGTDAANTSLIGKICTNVSGMFSTLFKKGGSPKSRPVRPRFGRRVDISGRQQEQTREQLAAKPRKRPHSDEQEDSDRAEKEEAEMEQGVEPLQQSEASRETVTKRRRLYDIAPQEAAAGRDLALDIRPTDPSNVRQSEQRPSNRGSPYGRPMLVGAALQTNRLLGRSNTPRAVRSLFKPSGQRNASGTAETEPVPQRTEQLRQRMEQRRLEHASASRASSSDSLSCPSGFFRPSLNEAAYSGGSSMSSSGRKPPERRGSIFYDGPTRYGGASAANTLAINLDVTRPSTSATSLLRVPDKNSTRDRKVARAESSLGSSAASKMLTKCYNDMEHNFEGGSRPPDNPNEEEVLKWAYPNEDSDQPNINKLMKQMLEYKQKDEAAESVEQVVLPPPDEQLIEQNVQKRQDSQATVTSGGGVEGQGANETLAEINPEREIVRQAEPEPQSEPELAKAGVDLTSEERQQEDNGEGQEDDEQEDKEYDKQEEEEHEVEKQEEQEQAEKVDEQAKSGQKNEEAEKKKESEREPSPPLFDFSSPLVLGSCPQPLGDVAGAITDFTFSNPEPLDPISNSLRQTNVPSAVAQPDGTFKALMAKTANQWVCDVCMIRNEPDAKKCVACESPPPARKPEQPAPSTSVAQPIAQPDSAFQALIAKNASKWVCDVCMIRNEPDAKKCVACESPQPARKPEQPAPSTSVAQPIAQPIAQPDSAFQALIAKNASKWVCDVCMVQNEPDAKKCVACECAKPPTKKSVEKPEPAAQKETTPSVAGFRFGSFNGAGPSTSGAAFPSTSFQNIPAQPRDTIGSKADTPFTLSFPPNTGATMIQQELQLASNAGGCGAAASSLFDVPSSTSEAFSFSGAWSESEWAIASGRQAQDDTGGETSAAAVGQQEEEQPQQQQADDLAMLEISGSDGTDDLGTDFRPRLETEFGFGP